MIVYLKHFSQKSPIKILELIFLSYLYWARKLFMMASSIRSCQKNPKYHQDYLMERNFYAYLYQELKRFYFGTQIRRDQLLSTPSFLGRLILVLILLGRLTLRSISTSCRCPTRINWGMYLNVVNQIILLNTLSWTEGICSSCGSHSIFFSGCHRSKL